MASSMQEALQSLERLAERCAQIEIKAQDAALKSSGLRREVGSAIHELDSVIGGNHHA